MPPPPHTHTRIHAHQFSLSGKCPHYFINFNSSSSIKYFRINFKYIKNFKSKARLNLCTLSSYLSNGDLLCCILYDSTFSVNICSGICDLIIFWGVIVSLLSKMCKLTPVLAPERCLLTYKIATIGVNLLQRKRWNAQYLYFLNTVWFFRHF